LGRLPEADPAEILFALPQAVVPTLLDDSARGHALLAWNPDRQFESRMPTPRPASKPGLSPGQRWPLASHDPAAQLAALAASEHWSCEQELPLYGGWIGYFSFEAGHAYLPFPWAAPEPSGMPQAAFARYPRSLLFRAGETLVLGPTAGGQAWLHEAQAVFDRAARSGRLTRVRPELVSQTSASAFQAAVARLREQIGQGELFQANLSHRLSGPYTASPRHLYAQLRPAQPTQMSAYRESAEGHAILSWSPERFLSMRGRLLQTQPIKGTAPRGRDALADAQQADALERSEKERAELTMIVDMARNDLGQVAVPGSVRVLSTGVVEAFPTLFHRTATIEAQARDGVGFADLFAACFPPASVTGAPKVRALQAIAEFEAEDRGPYCGAFGYWIPGADQADFSVMIRTAVVAAGQLHLRVGAGIVWDSDPQHEWEETLVKARYLQETHEQTSLRSS
jgi:anthranilate/para-aminobenzoate synthase component I